MQVPKLSDSFSDMFGQQVVELARGVAAQYEHLLSNQQRNLRHAIVALQDENAKLQAQVEEAMIFKEGLDGATIPPAPEVATGLDGTTIPPVPEVAQEHDMLNQIDQQHARRRTTVHDGQPLRYHAAQSAFALEEGSKQEHEIREVFEAIDIEGRGHINAYQVVSFAGRSAYVDSSYDSRVESTAKAILELNTQMPHLCPQDQPEELSLAGFQWMMHRSEVGAILSEEAATELADMRDRCVKRLATNTIARKTMVLTKDLNGAEQAPQTRAILEPVSAVVIVLNACVIGMSLDVQKTWQGWQVIEICFTFFFVTELAIKVRYLGLLETYLGSDWQWNLFDTIIVLVAVMDLAFYIFEHLNLTIHVDFTKVTVIRLVRLLRITRVVRLLKFPVFKDLRIMVSGVVGGLKTLFWALMLISMLVYIFGVMMRQLVLQEFTCDGCSSREVAAMNHIETHSDALFGSVSRSMFTVFRCFTDGCSSVDGTSLILWFWDAYGAVFVLLYTLFTIFMLFGVFNLIQAIFVEKTLEYAKVDSVKRREARYREDVRVAKELRDVVLKVFAYHQSPLSIAGGRQLERNKTGLLAMFGSRRTAENLEPQEPDNTELLQTSIGKSEFEQVMEDPEIRLILDDLEVAVTSSSKLFDILDSNGNGSLDVAEVTEGLMKLRGPADKGDVISASLTARSLQTTLKDMQQSHEKFGKTVLSALETIYRYQTIGASPRVAEVDGRLSVLTSECHSNENLSV